MILSPERWAGVVFVVDSAITSNYTVKGYRSFKEVQSALYLNMDVAAGIVKLLDAFSDAGSSFMVTSNESPVFYSAIQGPYYIGVVAGKLVPMISGVSLSSAFESGMSLYQFRHILLF